MVTAMQGEMGGDPGDLPDPVLFGEVVALVARHQDRHDEQRRRSVAAAAEASTRPLVIRRRVRRALEAEVAMLEAFIADPATGVGARGAAACRLAVQRDRLARL